MPGERRKRKMEGVPVLKLPPRHLGGVIHALRTHEFDRDGFREAVMELFGADMDEKSVFRGMAIPTLRSLGFMAGFESEMRLTADGSVVGLGLAKRPADNAPLAVVLAEIEQRRGLDYVWTMKHTPTAEVVRALVAKESPEGKRDGDVVGRVRRWLGYLQFAGLVQRLDDTKAFVRNAVPEYRIAQREFQPTLSNCYRSLSPRAIGEAIVPIEDIRRCMAEGFYSRGVVLSSHRFDVCLERDIQRANSGVCLHRSMGADEALFVSRGIGYSSLSIRGQQ